MKVEFCTTLDVRKGAGREWELLAPFVVRVVDEGKPETWHRVPAGFVTDFASVPRLPLAFLLAGDRAHRAATVHDWLYAERLGRDYADSVFRAAMAAEGVGGFVASLMHAGVRLGGAGRYAGRRR